MSEKLYRSSSTLKLSSVVTMSVIIISVSIITSGFANIAAAQTNKDSTALLNQVEKYQSVWNTHNATALAEFFTDDADFIMGNLSLINGRVAIQNWWQNYFNRQEPERMLTIIVNSLRIITNDVALINVTTTTASNDTQGEKLPTRKARGTWVLHRQNGNWLIIAMRGMPTEEDQIIRNFDN
jgi:uncharacterized protein (TIGR02246 family)